MSICGIISSIQDELDLTSNFDVMYRMGKDSEEIEV